MMSYTGIVYMCVYVVSSVLDAGVSTQGGGQPIHGEFSFLLCCTSFVNYDLPLSCPCPCPCRSTCRDADGVDSDLRKKISDRLPSIEDQELAAVATTASASSDAEAADGKGAPVRISLTPATLARALPHIRRVMGRGSGSGSGGGEAARGSALGLLRGGGLVFPESRATAVAAMKHGEVGGWLGGWVCAQDGGVVSFFWVSRKALRLV